MEIVTSGHSLRPGFITEAMDVGASDSDIMQQTKHKTDRELRNYRQDTGAGVSPWDAVMEIIEAEAA